MAAGIDFTNCYTDYGFWPWAVFLPLAAVVLYFHRPLAGLLARDPAWRAIVRRAVVFLAGGFLVSGVLALTGLLPCD